MACSTRSMRAFLVGAAGLALAIPASAQLYSSRQVNGAGATLFVDFFLLPGSTADAVDVDGDLRSGAFDTNGDTIVDSIDQLADSTISVITPPLPPFDFRNNWWTVQYRSVGSVEGFTEFLDYQGCGFLPEAIPSERGIINRNSFAINGVVQPPIQGFAACATDGDGDGVNEGASGTPACPPSIDFGNTDVNTLWAVQANVTTGANWNAKPGDNGYGTNPNGSNGDPALGQTGEDHNLPNLTRPCSGTPITFDLLTSSPGPNTIFDTPIAYSPVAIIANRGVFGLNSAAAAFTRTDMRHMLVTGRRIDGENLFVAVRDKGSGTRNAFVNSFGVDPSRSVGDNVGKRITTTTRQSLGPAHQVAACGGSSVVETAVQNNRLATGHTGLVGPSRAVTDAYAGVYEIIGVINDTVGGTTIVRPTIDNVLLNSNPATSYRVGGIQTLNTRGNPDANRALTDPLYEVGPTMTNQNAADLINNITTSVANFVTNPTLPANERLPGELLARTYFQIAGMDFLPAIDDPEVYLDNPQDAAVVAFIQANNEIRTTGPTPTPAYNAINANSGLRVPNRQSNPSGPDYPGNLYNDGSTGSGYTYYVGGVAQPVITSAGRLSQRNALHADMNYDGARDANDIDRLVRAINARETSTVSTYADVAYAPGNVGTQTADVIILQVMADVNGDGNVDRKDARYFADGLSMVPCATARKLDRKTGFRNVDLAAQGLGLALPYLPVSAIQQPSGDVIGYTVGAARIDVAGNSFSSKGAVPTGHDGLINCTDVAYIAANAGDWRNLDQAQSIDLSADMNGDLLINGCDIGEAYVVMGLPDFDLDGVIGSGDLGVLLGNWLTSPAGCSFCSGDANSDGTVDSADLGILLANWLETSCGNYSSLSCAVGTCP